MRVLVIMAYSEDYRLGRLCEAVNRAWATRHGYAFHSEVLSREAMLAAVAPRAHVTWYKVALINRLLAQQQDEAGQAVDGHGQGEEHAQQRAEPSYILWLDADAVVVRQQRSVAGLLADACSSRGAACDLVLGEDLGASCRVNAGVLLVRADSAWSRALWRDVWARPKKFHTRRFFEQAALETQLHWRGEGLSKVEPFHSYLGGPTGAKRFEHVCVLPRHMLNTNVVSEHQSMCTSKTDEKTEAVDACEFVFQALPCDAMVLEYALLD